jgi:hypothetical protein
VAVSATYARCPRTPRVEDAAIAAARQLRYEPLALNGTPTHSCSLGSIGNGLEGMAEGVPS